MSGHNTAWAQALMSAERVLPDYSWPVHVPLDKLMRDVAHESRAASAMAAAVLPHWHVGESVARHQ